MNTTMQKYKEFPLLFMSYNEPTSFMSGENAQRLNNGNVSTSTFGPITQDLGSGNYSVWYPQVVNLASSGQFEAAPKYRKLNELSPSSRNLKSSPAKR